MAGDNDCGGLLGAAGVGLYPVLTLWTFFGMAFVADEYFGPALDGLVAKYRVPDAVAGATILAVGTSFPELIIGFASQFLMEPEPSISMGVTAGSAIFNQLAIVGACVLAAPGGRLKISWRAMLRDVLLWVATIGLSAGLLSDGEVSALDGWLMVGLYGIYVVLCGCWNKIDALLTGGPKGSDDEDKAAADNALETGGSVAESLLGSQAQKEAHGGVKNRHWKPAARVMRMILPREPRHHGNAIYCPTDPHLRHLGDCHDETPVPGSAEDDDTHPFDAYDSAIAAVGASRDEEETKASAANEEHHHDKDHGPLGGPMPPGIVAKFKYVVQSPFAIVCYVLLLPFLRRRQMHEVSALIGGAILAGIAFLMTKWLELSACYLSIPTITLSLLFSAPGTSLPELMVASGVARKGLGTSAVSTSLGSNIFDILVALGLPWAIYATAVEPIKIDSTLVLTCLMAASTGTFLVVAFASSWAISRPFGFLLLGLYIAFDIYVILEAVPGLPISGLSSIG